MADNRCRKMQQVGLLAYERVLCAMPGVYITTRSGCQLAGSRLQPARRISRADFPQDLALVSLAIDLVLACPGSRWCSARELRRGHPQAHLPDGVLILPEGGRVAIELDPNANRNRAALYRCYARTRDYQAVRFFISDSAAAARLARDLPGIAVQSWRVPEESAAVDQRAHVFRRVGPRPR